MRIPTAAPLALAAATALAGSLLASAPASAASHQGGLHLGKIQYDSPGKDTRTNTSLNAEYVDIHNNGKAKLQLKGYKLKDDTGYTYTFPSFTVAAGKTVRVHTGKGKNSGTHVYWNRGSYVWNNTGDKARLIKPSGTLRDSCSWGKGNGVKVCH
ncbi:MULTISPECIES: lamin tail domain-containing protein [Streptomyces]|uniref:Lamin tail domain-containing protein n=1 Tax=[Kitasatospora] papulosa TaxID=1464011 RepID=A0ABZ1K3V3_9ACTN|nr:MULTISPECIES: lamin tail domain-containing protein [Streptomyces]MBD2831586.1 lamin tail domain-containing protein [Streptomyces pratensis]MDX3183015.1 lamin tail domain-containing protein [Streptomyces sp. ME02-7008A-1]MDX3303468.1 lamin tail domain-containing protein [Streptomyces sp. ME02-7008A]MEE1779642.1 lamin tail domain-containing protein [Streptomyces sp. JV181]MYT61684.1 lamin tail domain-containing protein [Streptomyces sp. SID7834]